jgi:hypothetical protein
MRFFSLWLPAICLSSVAAMAQTNVAPATAPPAAGDVPVTKADDQKMICVEQDTGTASRLRPKRVCHTRQEWDKLGGIPK